MICPACTKTIPDDSRFCASCGAPIDPSNTPTLTRVDSPPSPAAPAPPRSDSASRRSPSHPSSFGFEARYVPGATLAGRYRIVSPLGKGGMGEVYRAEDLKLGQTVALKFLPQSLARNEESLARFTREVRLARQVSHPNVCRVFDIGEADGQTFLTMEFVDGEDIASLMRRIGRLPADKALEIARQVCAGLAAAHEHGIIHRDLKPANIMLDGRGRARITDFGLAGLSAEVQGADARAGTPAYMSPEQFSGGEVTPKSDLYSLGLVMYEIFTGKRPYDAATFEDMARLREKSAPTAPSSYLKDIDPLVERVILRCLEKDPAKRPASALQVAAALPGGDPLAAALAAGETPSPEMVAAAGAEGALAPWKAISLLAGLVVLLCAAVFLHDHAQLINLLPPGKSPEILRENARNILQRIGYSEPPADSAYWFSVDDSYWAYSSRFPSPERYRKVPDEFPSPLHFNYRQSPQPLKTHLPYVVDPQNPPPTAPGDSTVALDMQGRLCSFRITPLAPPEAPSDSPPPDSKPSALPDTPDWQPLFVAAGLDLAQFTPADAAWYPHDPMDRQFVWKGLLSGKPVRVQAGSYRGRPVFFAVLGPWARPVETEYNATLGARKLVNWISLVVPLSALALAFFLARRNIRLGRSDTKGALRAAGFIFVVTLFAFPLDSHWSSDPRWEWIWLQITIALGAGLALQYALFYQGLEPYFRRAWPELLISWSRLLAGEFRNPLVGRDVLAGVLFGVCMALSRHAADALPYWFSVKSVTPHFQETGWMLRGLFPFLSNLVGGTLDSLMNSLGCLTIFFIGWKLGKRKWLAALMLLVVGTLFNLQTENPWPLLPFALLVAVFVVICLIRAGVLGLTFAFFAFLTLQEQSLTSDFSRWYAPYSLMALLALLAIAFYGFLVSLGGRRLFATALDD
jgi:serine/threonine-protein kinase